MSCLDEVRCGLQGLGARSRRDLLRKTWVPQGKSLKDLEEEKSVVIRFVVGYRCRPKQPPAHVLPTAPLPEQSFIPACRILTIKSVQAVPDLTEQCCTLVQWTFQVAEREACTLRY